jgi:hypothetical protein
LIDGSIKAIDSPNLDLHDLKRNLETVGKMIDITNKYLQSEEAGGG